ncbi:MAG: ABC transporter ATP-binding protein [Desulfobulbaceae bacterium]|nr:ABC transporter ATP-binding protein [Desulfobulbaceae bacterium]
MISVKNISKRFKVYHSPSDRLKEIILRRPFHKNFQALQNISFEVGSGETLGIIGQNGAGKSTLLKALTGIIIPDSGSISLDGKITGLLELGTGFNGEFSGLDNIFMNGTYLGLTRTEIESRLDKIIDFTELHDFIEEPLKTYSSGMTMRLAFSVAIHADPQAFVIDEALSVGDAYFQQKCLQKIREFKKNGGSIVFVSHEMNAVKVLCDKAILLEKGEIIGSGDPESVINSYNFLIASISQKEKIKKDSAAASSYGNGAVTINKISLQDENGKEADIFFSGQPLTISLTIHARENLDDLTVGILIRDRLGQDIFGTNTFHLDQQLSLQKNQICSISFQFDQVNIGPGKYSLTVAAHSSDTHVDACYCWMDNCKSFELLFGRGFPFVGLCRLEPQLQINKKSN